MAGQTCNLKTGNCVSEGEWIPIEDVGGKLEVGDLVETPSKVPSSVPIFGGIVIPLVNHYGIYLEIDGNPMVAHNSATPGNPEITTLEKFENGRKIQRIIRTGLDSDFIIKKLQECQDKKYDYTDFNCEDFINNICGCNVGYDQRFAWVLFFIVIFLVFLAFKK